MMFTKPLFHKERMIIDRNIFKIMTFPFRGKAQRGKPGSLGH